MSRAPDGLTLPGETANLIEQGCETTYRKAERVLRMVRRLEADHREREMMAWFAAHPNVRPVLFAECPPMTYPESSATPRKDS